MINSRSQGWLHWASIILAIAGVVVAGYLTYSGFTLTSTLCVPGGGCDTIRQSPYSQVLGVPVALIGLLGYLACLAALILERSSSFFSRNGPMIVFGLSLIGFLYSAYLTYPEAFVILAFCPYCVASAVIMTAIFSIAIGRALRAVET